MKTLAVSLTVVFVTLKLVGVITWPWLWVISPLPIWLILIVLIAFICAIGKAEGEQEENNRIRSKWQQRVDEIRAVREHNKMLILALLICAAMYSCRPAQNVTACPKPFSGKFNK